LSQDRTRKELTDFIDKAMKDSKTEIYPDVLTGGDKK